MKKNAFAILVKDLILAAIAWGVATMLLNSLAVEGAGTLAMMFAGVPFGWRIASKFITAVSMRGVGEKLLISVLVGFVAIFVVLGWDVVRCIGQLMGGTGAKKQRRRYAESC